MPDVRSAYRVCPFCEATCGLKIDVEGETIVAVRGDKDDPFSRGFICPKAYGLKELYHDPERLRRPLRRSGRGWEEIGWEQAIDEVAARLIELRERHGNDAIGMYTGNPVVHDLGALLYRPVLQRALASRSIFNSSAIDTLPKIVQTGLMFGRQFPGGVPVPDVDRSDYLLVIGANPLISHGSLMTMPDAPGRIKKVIERGGKVVVVDPRRSETARIASEHHFIRPGSDAAFLLAIVHTLFDERLADLGAADALVNGLDAVEAAARGFAPEHVAAYCGIAAETTRRLARELAAAPSAACYGRLGTCVQEFGTLASWGCDLINILTGNLDRPGGVMFTTPAAPIGSLLPPGKGFEIGRWKSRVSGRPEVGDMIPSSTMAEEMLTGGPGQVRAMILLMTNPLRSAANSAELERALSGLDFLVAIDFYLNETTRHADIILPTPSPAEQSNYEIGLYLLSVRNVAKWSWAALPPPAGTPETWQVLSALSARLMGLGGMPEEDVDDFIFAQLVQSVTGDGCPWPGLAPEEVIAKVQGAIGPERIIDMLLRIGPYGEGFGRREGGLSLAAVKAAEHGIDLGPLEPRLPEIVNTHSGLVELAPAVMIADLDRLRARLADSASAASGTGAVQAQSRADRDDGAQAAAAASRADCEAAVQAGGAAMLLIGRRDLRATNSFTHNLPALMKGPERCTLQVSPVDAERLGLRNGGLARVGSRVGSVLAPVELSDDLMPGVVSLPHGWGHDAEGTRISVANARPGVNTNLLTDNQAYDVASGAAVLFGTPVTVEPG